MFQSNSLLREYLYVIQSSTVAVKFSVSIQLPIKGVFILGGDPVDNSGSVCFNPTPY